MKSADQPEQASFDELLISRVLCMLVHRFICNVNDMRALIGLNICRCGPGQCGLDAV